MGSSKKTGSFEKIEKGAESLVSPSRALLSESNSTPKNRQGEEPGSARRLHSRSVQRHASSSLRGRVPVGTGITHSG